MTQKELLYYEDAIGHEVNIIKICEDSIKKLEDENLINFMQGEIEMHKSLKEKLMNKLGSEINE